jgi:general secretion pathway protein A
VLAQAGMGKSALLGYLRESLHNESEIASFPGSFETRAELVRSVMAIVGVQGISRDLSDNLRRFEQWLRGRRESGRTVVLICDNAHELDFETIRNLSAFSEFEDGRQKLLQIVMAGRQEFLGKLSDQRSESAGERVNLYCRLAPLDQAEVHSYVLHRLRIAGCSRQLFSPEALSAIALYSRGVPLNIHMICRHCQSLAAGVNLPTVDEKIVADAAYDLVLRNQPANHWDDADDLSGGSARNSKGKARDRRGLRLV